MNLGKQKIKVIAGSIPFSGHLIPLIRIIQALNKSHQFEILFVSSQFAIQKINLPQEIKKIGLKDETQIFAKQNQFQTMLAYQYDQIWNQQLSSLIQEFKPNVIFSDFCATSLIKMGKRFGIPTVIHSASPYSSIIPLSDFPTVNKSISLFGVIINYNNILKHFLPKKIKSLVQFGLLFANSLVMFSSFFGIEEAYSFPPNIKMIGSTLSRQQTESNIQNDLKIWIEDKKNNNKDIIYVSFGTIVRISQKFINFLYQGLKKMDVAVIWSLRQGDIPEQNPNFYVRKWLPQWEILKTQQVKLMITHCGWGGITECIQAAKPMLCLPNFADQKINAITIVNQGIGMVLRQQKKINVSPKLIDEFNFTHEELQQKVNVLIRDQSYVRRLQKLRGIMMTETGGCEQAVSLIRNAAVYGIDHLIDRNVQKLQKKSIVPLFVVLIISIILLLFWSVFNNGESTQTL